MSRIYRLLWGQLVTVLTVVAATVMAVRSEPAQIVALVVALGSLGGVLGLAWGSEAWAPRHPVLVGTGVAAVASLALPGLVVLVGGWAVPVCLLLGLVSPWALGNTRLRRWAGTVDPGPAADNVGSRLRLDWEASSRALASTTRSQDHVLLADLRSRLLAEIEEHHGALPAYVWSPVALPGR